VLNAHDEASALLAQVVPNDVRVVAYGVPSRGPESLPADLRATRIEPGWEGTRIAVEGSGALAHAPAEIRIRAIGDIYAENALAALAAALVAGVPPDCARAALGAAPVPRGRFEVVSEVGRGPHVVVDYAHTPDALARTLDIARMVAAGGKVVVVFGAGGDRDKAKREPMGAAASTADRIVLTSDNPRSEDPTRIADAIRAGIRAGADVRTELDRRRAIVAAIADAAEADVVVVAGKGHETAQLVGGAAVPFDDAEVARSALTGRSGANSPAPPTSGRWR
jgi:UDP-N-acetylmuramoyl-L-alanyl-D-glutamate--2,6-diaminopimelate ligase